MGPFTLNFNNTIGISKFRFYEVDNVAAGVSVTKIALLGIKGMWDSHLSIVAAINRDTDK